MNDATPSARPVLRGMPEGMLAVLVELFGPGVSQVRVVERSWFNLLHGGPRATTRRRRIYLRGSAAEFFADPLLVLHEYCHVLLQWEPGRLTTPRYVRECLRCGYWMNPFEIEARRFAADNLHRLMPLFSPAAIRAGTAGQPPPPAADPGRGSPRPT
jgi:hypothetical protein